MVIAECTCYDVLSFCTEKIDVHFVILVKSVQSFSSIRVFILRKILREESEATLCKLVT